MSPYAFSGGDVTVGGRAVALEDSWLERLGPCFESEQMSRLRDFLLAQKQQGRTVVPPGSEIFRAFHETAFAQVRVVLVGQDPYHGPGQANGLAFSVDQSLPLPPSLVNIFKELSQDLGKPAPRSGNLQHWAAQGVLLLNSVLTVEQGCAASHAGRGWEWFTDAVISVLNSEREHLVFLLWGAYAQKKGQCIDRGRHLVLQAPHPSPLSAHRGFFGCRHFSQANAYLIQYGLRPIDWS